MKHKKLNSEQNKIVAISRLGFLLGFIVNIQQMLRKTDILWCVGN